MRRRCLSVVFVQGYALSGLLVNKIFFSITQGVALGYSITPLQGLMFVVAPLDVENVKLSVEFFLLKLGFFE